MIHIFSFLGQTDLARCVQVSRSWRLAAYDPSLHKSLSLTHLYNSGEGASGGRGQRRGASDSWSAQ
jgi:hypothetical protein